MKRWPLWLAISLLFVESAQALAVPSIVTDTLSSVFSIVPELWLIRFAYWIIIFTLFYFVLARVVFKEKGSTAAILAFSISLISALITPEALLVLIFKTYSVIGGVLLLLAPILGVIFLVRKFGDGWYSHLLKMVIFLIAAGLFAYLASNVDMSFLGNSTVMGVHTFAWIGSVVFIFAALFQLFAFLARVTGHSWGHGSSRRSKGFDNAVDRAKKTERKDRGKLENEERNMEAEEQRLMRMLRQLKDALANIREGTPNQREQAMRQMKSYVDTISALIDQLAAQVRDRDAEIHDLVSVIMDDQRLDELVKDEEQALKYFRNGFKYVMVHLGQVFRRHLTPQQQEQELRVVEQTIDKLLRLGQKLELEEEDVEHEVEH